MYTPNRQTKGKSFTLLFASIIATAVSMNVWAAVPSDGTLVMHDLGPGHTAIFYIDQGKKLWIPNWYIHSPRLENVLSTKLITA
jgi:hypothetical protein